MVSIRFLSTPITGLYEAEICVQNFQFLAENHGLYNSQWFSIRFLSASYLTPDSLLEGSTKLQFASSCSSPLVIHYHQSEVGEDSSKIPPFPPTRKYCFI